VRAGSLGQNDLIRKVSELGTIARDGNFRQSAILSADNQWVGYFASDGLRKVSIDGGPSTLVCGTVSAPRGASWGPDDTIFFSTSDPASGLLSVSANGGEPTILTTVDRAQNELDHLFPFLLPDGHSVLLTVVSTGGANTGTGNRIDVLDLNTGTGTPVIANAAQGEYVDTGHLVYAVSNSLHAVTFDLRTLSVSGSAVPVVEQLMMFGTGAAEFSVSRQGSLVMMNGTPETYAESRTLVWLDRQGREEPIQAPTRAYMVPWISPEDSSPRRLTFATGTTTSDLISAADADASDVFYDPRHEPGLDSRRQASRLGRSRRNGHAEHFLAGRRRDRRTRADHSIRKPAVSERGYARRNAPARVREWRRNLADGRQDGPAAHGPQY
jgi:hypothetical protein